MLTKGRFKGTVSFLLFIAFCFHANAAVFFVTETLDTTKTASLRGAIMAANQIGGRNTIILGRAPNYWQPSWPWVYRLTIPGANEGASVTGDLNINRGELTIIGMSRSVTIDATGLGDRVFQVSSNAQLTLDNLTIKGGTAPSDAGLSGGGQFGGCVYNSGTLILEQCVITNNASGVGQPVNGNIGGTSGGDGGGIYNNGKLQANNCIIVGNTCGAGVDSAFGGNGGGIRNDGYCELTDCIINDNQAGAGGDPGNIIGAGGYGGNGGGIFNSGTLILNECIVGENTAGVGVGGGDASGLVSNFTPGGPGGNGGSGGGIYNVGELEINFSTVYGNDTGNGGVGGSFDWGGNAGTGGDGGGVFNAGELSLNTSTISGNSCGSGGNGGAGALGAASGGAGGSGGGIYNSGANSVWGINPGSSELTSSTITLNACGAGGIGGNGFTPVFGYDNTNPASGGDAGDGGGIANDAGTNAVIVRNTLIAQNLPNTGGAPGTNTSSLLGLSLSQGLPTNDVFVGNPGAGSVGLDVVGVFTSEGFNLIGMGDGSTGFINGVNADQAGSEAVPLDPLLGSLQMHGGFAPTHALLWGSPAIDQGKCFGIRRDQRGANRPHIFSSISKPQGGDGSDIGAFELENR